VIEIRGMDREDVAFARSLTDIERWGHLDEDFQRFLDLNPGGCFVACEHRKRLGIVTSMIHGDHAFLGNLIVRKDARARGVGLRLMERVIAWLDGKGVQTIELDGVFRAVETYRIMGFRDKYLSLRFMRPAAKRQRITPAQEVCRAPDVARILQYDRERVKIDRSMFLAHLLKGHPDTTYTVDRQGMSAYAVTRTRATSYIHIGPLVADNAENASILLSFICTEHAESDLTIGVPGVNTSALGVVLQRGFVHRPPSLRMYRGERVDYEDSVHGIISADVG
jgi:GNAT superfamily N-acetyltransferase